MLDQILRDLQQIYTDISLHQKETLTRFKFGCLTGCGDCCNSREVESSIGEMLPLALAVIKDKKFNEIYDKLLSADLPCIFYKSSTNDKSKGHCTVYENRPSICRLFGSSIVETKNNSFELSVCRFQKSKFPNEIKEANQKLSEASKSSSMQSFGQRIRMMFITQPSLAEVLPINQALLRAIQFVQMRLSFQGEGTQA